MYDGGWLRGQWEESGDQLFAKALGLGGQKRLEWESGEAGEVGVAG